MIVKANKVVSLRFTMKNNRGEILQDIMAGTPVNYLHGSGSILPVLEAGIEGLEPGDHKSVVFNDNNLGVGESYYIDIVIDDVREATPVELQKGKPEAKQVDNSCGPECHC